MLYTISFLDKPRDLVKISTNSGERSSRILVRNHDFALCLFKTKKCTIYCMNALKAFKTVEVQ